MIFEIVAYIWFKIIIEFLIGAGFALGALIGITCFVEFFRKKSTPSGLMQCGWILVPFVAIIGGILGIVIL